MGTHEDDEEIEESSCTSEDDEEDDVEEGNAFEQALRKHVKMEKLNSE